MRHNYKKVHSGKASGRPMELGWVVRKAIDTNSGLKDDRRFDFSFVKVYLMLISCGL